MTTRSRYSSTPQPVATTTDSPAPQEDTSHLMKTDKWFLKPLVFFYNWFYGGMLRPEDPFWMQARKATIAVLLFAAASVFTSIQQATDHQRMQNPILLFGVILNIGRNVLVSIPSYIYCRVTRTCTEMFFTAIIILQLIFDILVAARYPGFNIWPSTAALCFLGFAGQARFRPLVCLLATTSIFIGGMNSGTKPQLAFPGAPIDPPSPATVVMVVCIFLLLVLWIYLTMLRFNAMLAASNKAVTVSLDIAQMLRDYDTDGVTQLLNEYSNDVDRDEKLVKAFRDINGNLEKYRPHLPNYVLPQDAEADDEGHRTPAGEQRSSNANNHVQDPSSTPGTALGGDVMNATTTPRRSARGGGLAAGLEKRVDTARSRHSHEGVLHLKGGAAALTHLERATVGQITMCVMDVSWHAVNGGGGMISVGSAPRLDDAPSQQQIKSSAPTAASVSLLDTDRCHALVAAMNDAALHSQASLHGFIGDRIVATWNATRRVAKSESRACFFADAVRKQSRASSLGLRGAICTGKAVFMFAGGARLKTFVCSAPDMSRRLAAAMQRTVHLNITTVDYATREHAAVDFATRGVALLDDTVVDETDVVGDVLSRDQLVDVAKPAEMASPRSALQNGASSVVLRCIYELLHERPPAERDQEWMYVLQGHSNDPNEKVTQALHLLALGKLEEAAEKMNDVDATTACAPGVKEVHAAIDRLTLRR